MNIGQSLKMATKSIFSNVGRSILTMLGVIIGLAAVIILVSYAQGQNIAMQAYYDSMGTNTINVSAYTWRSGTDITQMLYDYCLGLDGVAGVTPNGQVNVTISYESKTLSNSDWNTMTTVYLGSDQYGKCNDFTIAKGRELSYLDCKRLNKVCVLGSATADELFSFADPIGKTITLNGTPFLVVGVYQSKSAGVNTGTGEDGQWIKDEIKRKDRMVLIPYTMTRYFNNNESISDYVVRAKTKDDIKDLMANLRSYLSTIISEDSGWSDVSAPSDWQDSQNEATAMQQRFLGGIAAISLLVGGIGIMNIMLVTVTERTREIGIRKAIGAERRSIIIQFLIEAAMICGIGGIFGIIVGYIGTLIVCKLSFDAIMFPSVGITFGAAAISIILGIIFGMYPAIKASGLQPVVALRAE
ncbi:MAG: ABC transporter permease [Clostridiales bacterium]|nr:ABC transporter permease [Clostridiales bacterium]